jgi:hypothetical protein
LGFVRLSRAFPDRRGGGFPSPSLLRFTRPLSGRAEERRSRASPTTEQALPLAGRPTLLRFSTRTCPRLLPTTVFLSVTRLEVSQPARSILSLRRTRPPEGSRRASLPGLPPTARRPPDSTPLASPQPARSAALPLGLVKGDPKTARVAPSGRGRSSRVVRTRPRDPRPRSEDRRLRARRASPETAEVVWSGPPKHLLRSEDRRARSEGPHP